MFFVPLVCLVLRVSQRRLAYQVFDTGAAEDMAHSSLRFGIGRFTTEAEIDFVVKHIIGTVNKLRDMRYVFQTLCNPRLIPP
jgi:cysteine sulfinate desulfinase/cysteine desulfurase-like protein